MKNVILIIAVFLAFVTSYAQTTPKPTRPLPQGVVKEIGNISIVSKTKLVYDSWTQTKDTVRIAVKRLAYDVTAAKYVAQIASYVKVDGGYKTISEKTKVITKSELDAIFTASANPANANESYSSELEGLFVRFLLSDTGGLYGSTSTNWKINK